MATLYCSNAGGGSGADFNNLATLPTTTGWTRGNTYVLVKGAYTGRTCSTVASGTTTITIRMASAADSAVAGYSTTLFNAPATFSTKLQFTTPYWIWNGITGGGAENFYTGSFGLQVTETRDAEPVLDFSSSASNITISHIDMIGKGSASTSGGSASNDGVAIYNCSSITVSNFRMTGIGRCPFFISSQNCIFENGYVVSYFGSVSVHSEIASIWSFSGTVGDVTFRNNLFADCQSTGGIMWDNQDNTSAVCRVYGNTFYKPSGATWESANGLIGGWTGSQGEECRNLLVYNNTFINIDQLVLGTLPNIFSGNIAKNNIFYVCQSPEFDIFGTHDYNEFNASGGTHSEANGTTSTGDIFVDYVGLDFSLDANTTAGTNLGSPYNTDPLGNTRTTWTRGAFEFEDAPVGGTLNVTNLTCATMTVG